MSGAEGRQYPYRVIKWAARLAALFWQMDRPLGRPTRARGCVYGGKAVGFDLGSDCVVTCLRCGHAFYVGATLSQSDSETPWLPYGVCKQPGMAVWAGR